MEESMKTTTLTGEEAFEALGYVKSPAGSFIKNSHTVCETILPIMREETSVLLTSTKAGFDAIEIKASVVHALHKWLEERGL